jgi:hypothetical protein
MNNLLAKKEEGIKKFLFAFLLGAILATIGVFFIGKAYIDTLNNKINNLESASKNYPEAIQFIMEHPEYAEIIKDNHDNYMRAAEDAFVKGLQLETEGKE